MRDSATSALTFLLNRIEEDELLATKALPTNPTHWLVEGPAVSDHGWWIYAAGVKFPSRDIADHVAHHNPSRILDECAAKRTLIKDHADTHTTPVEECSCPIILTMASAYAWHPDYADATGRPSRQRPVRVLEGADLDLSREVYNEPPEYASLRGPLA